MEEIIMGRKAIDITGQKFGKWLVLERVHKQTSNQAAYWKCQCECGAIHEIAGIDLRAGKTVQCKHCAGLEKKKYIKTRSHSINHKQQEIGKRYGNLVVIEFAYQTLGGSMWKCRCNCGNETIVRINNLHSGKTTSCGCIKSKGEATIREILIKNQINFTQEYTFDDLLGLNGGKLRFDFAIFDLNQKLIKLLEFQGRQHFEQTKLWNNDNKIHDEYKRKYCKEHNIELLEIPYYDINKISLDYLGL